MCRQQGPSLLMRFGREADLLRGELPCFSPLASRQSLPHQRSDISTYSCFTGVSLAGSESSGQEHAPIPDPLACNELLEEVQQQQQKPTPGKTRRSDRHTDHALPANDLQRFVEMARNEHERSLEVCPSSYLRHERQGMREEHRAVSVNWFIEACEACNFHAATLFLAVAYFDRFCSVAKDVSPGMLQLVATASLSIAAKSEEVLQPTPAEWVDIADNSFSAKDLVHMEFLLLHYLGWRVRTPTIYTFTRLFSLALGLDADAHNEAVRVTELALGDYSMLSFSYSTVAAAGLLVSHQLLGLDFNVALLLDLAPFLGPHDVLACAAALKQQLHTKSLQPAPQHLELSVESLPSGDEAWRFGDCRDWRLEHCEELQHRFTAAGMAAAQ